MINHMTDYLQFNYLHKNNVKNPWSYSVLCKDNYEFI